MRALKLIGLVSFLLIPMVAWITPATSAANTYSEVIPVEAVITQHGNAAGSANALGALEQTGNDNDPGKFVLFNAVDTP